MKKKEHINEDLSDIAYRLLMTGKVITYEDILNEYIEEDVSVSKHPQYNVLKKTIPVLVKELRDYGCNIIESREKRKVYYQYKGANKLHNVHFRKELLGKYSEINECIKEKVPVRFEYCPFDKPSFEITFHPHEIKEYNGRLFAIGVSEIPHYEPMRKFVVAIDRINGEIRGSRSSYLAPFENEYLYLQDLVGITYINGTVKTDITLRAYGKYTYGRLVTKPIHNSQKTVSEYQEEKGYGEVMINVFPNKELMGQILSYGSFLEVLSPDELRNTIRNELAILSERYK